MALKVEESVFKPSSRTAMTLSKPQSSSVKQVQYSSQGFSSDLNKTYLKA